MRLYSKLQCRNHPNQLMAGQVSPRTEDTTEATIRHKDLRLVKQILDAISHLILEVCLSSIYR